jgi:hypothetical protein
MTTTKTFPEFDTRQRGSAGRWEILIETYVRVLREGAYWRVLIRNNMSYSSEVEVAQVLPRDIERFLMDCKKTELLYMLPSYSQRSNMEQMKSLLPCGSHLTNKEEDLLRYGNTIHPNSRRMV